MNRREFIGVSTCFLGLQTIPWSIISAEDSVTANHWQRLPLTKKRMQELGITGGDGFQYVYALNFAPSNPKIAYLSVDQSGVWRSDDGGHSWEPKFKGFFAYGARSIAVDPLNPLVVVAAGFLGFTAEDAAKYPMRCQGIYLTLDGGESWRMVRPTDFYRQDSKGSLFAFDSNSSTNEGRDRSLNIWCASAVEGLLKSEDGGENWQQTDFRETGVHSLVLLPNRPGDILLASVNGLFEYHSGVAQKIGVGLPTYPRSIAVSAARPEKVYAALGFAGVATSADGGKNFTPPAKQFGRFFSTMDVTDIAVSPVDGNKLYLRANLSSNPPYASSDGGMTWRAPGAIDPEGLLDDPSFYFSSPFAPHPTQPQTCLHVTNGRARIIRTEDGGKSWHFSGSGFTGARMVDVQFISANHMIFGLTDHGLWETKDSGQTFSEIEIMRIRGAKSISAVAVSGENMVVGLGPWSGKGLAISHDSGKSFTALSELTEEFSFISFHPTIPGLVYAGPLVSDDFGRNWRRLPETIYAMAPNGEALYSYRKDKGGGTVLLVSRDGGKSFAPLLPPLSNMFVSTLTQIIAPALDILFVATAKGIFRIKNSLAELKDNHHGLSKDHFGNVYVSCLGYNPSQPNIIYAGRRSLGYGNGNGVFVSTDNGDTWQDSNLNLFPGMTVFAVKVNPFDGSVFLGTSFGTHVLDQTKKHAPVLIKIS